MDSPEILVVEHCDNSDNSDNRDNREHGERGENNNSEQHHHHHHHHHHIQIPTIITTSTNLQVKKSQEISCSAPAPKINFLADSSSSSASSASSDDSSSFTTTTKKSSTLFGYENENEEEEEDFSDEKLAVEDFMIPRRPIIFNSSLSTTNSSSSSSGSSTSASPTAVYSTMLNANNIVSNSMNILQATARLPNPPTLIEHSGLRLLIMDAPSQSNVHLYLKELERIGVKDIVRICEPTYSKEFVESTGIKVHDWVFPDGESPPSHIIESWLCLIDSKSPRSKLLKESSVDSVTSDAVAVHCVAGLGRAPVLVAIALIERGMSPLDAVTFIRQQRRGAINNKQLKFLEGYKPRHLRKDKCVIM